MSGGIEISDEKLKRKKEKVILRMCDELCVEAQE
jgi:hypothetical protein